MNRRYLNIDSNFRDRKQWPLPGEFEVNISQTGNKNKSNAIDPISNAAPLNTFNGSFTRNAPATVVNVGVLTTGAGVSSDPNQLIITGAANTLRLPENFYSGATIELTNGATTARRTISTYIYDENTDQATITVLQAFPDIILTAGTTGTISNPTEALTTSLTPQVFIPNGINFNNAYTDYYLINYSVVPGGVEVRQISSYDGETHLATLASAPTAGNWLAIHDYVLRREIPGLFETIQAPTTQNSFMLGPSASTTDNVYVGDFVRIASPLPTAPDFDTATAPFGEMRRVVAYDGATRTVTVAPSFTVIPVPGLFVEILRFTMDNVVPFNYTGSTVSHQEMVCYEIELISLILPNQTLRRGGRVAFWPYVWVELSNVSAPGSGVKNTIYSNNPYSTRMLFKASVDDVSNPLLVPFIKIDSDGMRQTVKFKPNDNLRFSVRLPDGEVFETVVSDTTSPTPPNPLIQISALFSLQRL